VALLAAAVSKTVLQAIAEAAPASGPGVVTGVRIWHGWGDVIFVEIAVGLEHNAGQPFHRAELRSLQSSVIEQLGSERHNVRVVESLI
jgi:hypothetical protein